MLLLIVRVLERRYALRLESVERVVRAAAVTAIAGAPAGILGLLDLYGRLIPVVSLRARLGIPDRGLELTDQFVIARLDGDVLALWVDSTEGVQEVAAEQVSPPPALLGAPPGLAGIVRLPEGIVLLESLPAFPLPHAVAEGS